MPSQTLANGDITFTYPASSSYIDLYAGQGNQNITLIGSSTIWINNGSSKFTYTLVNAQGSNNRVAFNGPGPVTVDLQAGYAIDGWGSKDVVVNFQTVSVPGNNGDKVYGTSGDDTIWINFNQKGSGLVDGRGGNNAIYLWQLQPSDVVIKTSADARSATLSRNGYTDTLLNITSIRFNFPDNTQNFSQSLKSFIDFSSVGSQTILGAKNQWQSLLGAQNNQLTYSFMTATPAYGGAEGGAGFTAPSDSYKAAVRTIFSQISKQINMDFVEVPDSASAYGQFRFGANQQTTSAGYSFSPLDSATDKAGDVWLDTSVLSQMSPGQQGFQSLLQNIGHALGLIAPLPETDTSGATVLLNQWNNSAYTVMSPNLASNRLWQTSMGPLDVQALQTLYGARTLPPVNGSNVFALSDQSGQQISTLSSATSANTLDCSKLSLGVSINLMPNSFSSVGKTADDLAALNNIFIDPLTSIQTLYGSAYDDVLMGNNLNNVFYPGDGNDIVDGKNGLNKVLFNKPSSSYNWFVSPGNSHLIISDTVQKSGTKDLFNIQRVSFQDTNFAFDLSGNSSGALTAEILGAALGPSALKNKQYVGAGLNLFDSGKSLQDVASLILSTGLVSSPDNASFVKAVWQNVIGAPIDDANLNTYVGQLNKGVFTQSSLLALAATVPQNLSSINLVGLVQTGLEYA
jgi:hypothetical protein